MERVKTFLKRKNIQISARRYGIDALGAMAQGLFCSLLIGTILDTLGAQLGIEALVTIGGYASAMSGPAMAIAIGYALTAPPLVLFSLATVGYAANALGSTTLDGGKGAGGPLAVLFIAIIAAEIGKAVSKETKIDILVTPLATILAGVGLSAWWAPAIGTAATSVGSIIMWATDLQPFLMGIVVSVVIGIALTLPISSAAICAALGLTGLAGGAAVAGCCANMIGYLAACHPHLGHYRAAGHLCVPISDERSLRRRGLRHGHLRPGGTHRGVRRVGGRCGQRGQGSHHRHGLGRHGPDLLPSPRSTHLGLRPGASPGRMDQRRRPEAGLTGRETRILAPGEFAPQAQSYFRDKPHRMEGRKKGGTSYGV